MEEGLTAAPQVREAGIQEVSGPGPPCPSHPTLKLKLNVKFPDIPLFQMQPLYMYCPWPGCLSPPLSHLETSYTSLSLCPGASPL